MDILYEDNHILAINKACGEVVHVDQSGDESLVDKAKAYLKEKYSKPGNVFLGLPHRLDRPTSGVIILARTGKMLPRLNKLFKNKEAVKRIYWAIVDHPPVPAEGFLEHYITRSKEVNKSYAHTREVADSKYAALSYRTLAHSDRYTLLEIELHTGRHHQIRAQLFRIGCHIKGDLKYGFPRSNPDGGIHLHARQVAFIHPVKNELLSITAPPPNEPLWNTFLKIMGESA